MSMILFQIKDNLLLNCVMMSYEKFVLLKQFYEQQKKLSIPNVKLEQTS